MDGPRTYNHDDSASLRTVTISTASMLEGYPDKCDFGQSKWIHKKDVVETLEGYFQSPQSTRSRSSSKTYEVVLVTHDIAADMKFLTGAGFNVLQRVSNRLGTSILFRASHRDVRPLALGFLLLHYGLAAKHLHNTGNDAYYKVRVMIAIAIDTFQNKRSAEDLETEKCTRIGVACEAATIKVCAELEGWSTSEDGNIAESSSLSPPLDERQGHTALGINRDQLRCDTKSTS